MMTRNRYLAYLFFNDYYAFLLICTGIYSIVKALKSGKPNLEFGSFWHNDNGIILPLVFILLGILFWFPTKVKIGVGLLGLVLIWISFFLEY